jgi:very-short-patch-repair endonuclease
MFKYRYDLKPRSRTLRNNMTEAGEERWFNIRRKQLRNVQFHRQRPIGKYIADFHAPVAKLVIEVDDSQQFDHDVMQADEKRINQLKFIGTQFMRFNNTDVPKNIEGVLETTHRAIEAAESAA